MAIINFGSINIDHVYQVDHFVQPGETLASSHYQQLLGGKGANQSIALAQAGGNVKHVGSINEHDASFKQALIKSGVDCRFLSCSDVPTGHAIIQVTPSGENAIVLFGGANQTISSKDVERALLDSRASDWVLTQNETSCIEEVLRSAKAKHLKVAFNPAPMSESVKQLPYECIDLLIVNETEAAAITGEPELDDIIAHFKANWQHAEVIITLGKQGVIMLRREQTIEVSAFSVDAVDTTAAGDTFIGYFLSAYAEHADARKALVRGCAASAISVTREGAAQSIPSQKEVDRFLAKHAG
ncbi:ribokinase [Alteromonas aestuariivivens]|uniref:Ribokinase n=1 Tax=Alteromonas aestuariivivens TaxID=1938339 RepID=A0A3D8ME09_9ALTE|nr:ribokinase [Alteromonas aestuariivivens]RDV29099.1 ribokinase [Alteromonas aestuariivivens]